MLENHEEFFKPARAKLPMRRDMILHRKTIFGGCGALRASLTHPTFRSINSLIPPANNNPSQFVKSVPPHDHPQKD